MRHWAFYLLIILSVFGLSQQIALAQNETDTKPLIKKWLAGRTIQEGSISLKTLQLWKKDDEVYEIAIVSLLNLNRDKKKELAIQSDCATVGNCELKIYVKAGGRYKTLLATDMVQTIKVLKSRTHRYFDLELATHDSAFDSYHRIFKFNGEKYKVKKCWTESYRILNGQGNAVELRKPKINYGCTEGY